MQRRKGVCGFDDLEADEFAEEEEVVGLMILQTYEFRQEELVGFDDLQLMNISQKFVAELGENLLQKNF
jgi:hypothetical protein